jgi:hypothetical protein
VIVTAAVGLEELAVDGDAVVWSESWPEEEGRIQHGVSEPADRRWTFATLTL